LNDEHYLVYQTSNTRNHPGAAHAPGRRQLEKTRDLEEQKTVLLEEKSRDIKVLKSRLDVEKEREIRELMKKYGHPATRHHF